MANASPNLKQLCRESVRKFLAGTKGHPPLQLHRLLLAEIEKPLFEEVMRHCQGNLTHAAELLGMSRATLRKKLDDYGIVH